MKIKVLESGKSRSKFSSDLGLGHVISDLELGHYTSDLGLGHITNNNEEKKLIFK